jgi:hypothetical protein
MGLGKSISREEAVKIVNSLKALNPNTQFDSVPQNTEWSPPLQGVNCDR